MQQHAFVSGDVEDICVKVTTHAVRTCFDLDSVCPGDDTCMPGKSKGGDCDCLTPTVPTSLWLMSSGDEPTQKQTYAHILVY